MDEVPGAWAMTIPAAAVLIEGIDVIHPAHRLICARACLHPSKISQRQILRSRMPFALPSTQASHAARR